MVAIPPCDTDGINISHELSADYHLGLVFEVNEPCKIIDHSDFIL